MRVNLIENLWHNLLSIVFLASIFVNTGNSQNLNQLYGEGNLDVFYANLSKEKIGNNQYLVNYHHVNDSEVSPYEVKYQYIQKNFDDSIEIPAKSYLHDLDLYFDNGVSIDAIGSDNVVTNNVLTNGQKLESSTAKYQVSISDTPLIQYHVSLSDRQVIGSEEVKINEQSSLAYIVQSTLHVTKQLDGNELSTSEEIIQDWFVADYGNVKRRRVSTSDSNTATTAMEVRFK